MGGNSVGALGLYIEGSEPRCQTVSPIAFTNRTWAELVLQILGAPLTTNNIDNMTRWMEFENSPQTWWGTAGKNNPLNNGLGSGGGAGLGPYPDLTAAAYWAAALINTDAPSLGWNAIKGALMANAGTAQFSVAVVSSHWAEGHYGVAAAGAPQQYVVAGRQPDFLKTVSVPPEVTADISHGGNISGTNGVGWTFVTPEAWQDSKVGPLPSEVDPLRSVLPPINISQLPAYSTDVPSTGSSTGSTAGGSPGGSTGGSPGGASGGSTGGQSGDPSGGQSGDPSGGQSEDPSGGQPSDSSG